MLAGWYEVSSLGRVRRRLPAPGTFPGRMLRLTVASHGYATVRASLGNAMSVHTVSVHDLVTSAFLGQRPPGTEVNHKDGNKTNNYVANLEYVSHSANVLHTYRLGLHAQATLDTSDVARIKAILADDRRRGIGVALATLYGVTPTTISDIKCGHSHVHA